MCAVAHEQQQLRVALRVAELLTWRAFAAAGFTYSIANGICAGFIFYAWMRTVRFCFQKICTKVSYFNASAYPESVDCTFPHPLMIVIACFCAIRFAYLAPGHQ